MSHTAEARSTAVPIPYRLFSQMKITGNPDKFGWHRLEKTRFLTLLRPENFDGNPLETFDARLKAFMDIPADSIARLTLRLVEGWCEDPAAVSAILASNIPARRDYVDKYFRSWFKPACETADSCKDDEYSMFGASFVAMHKGKK